MLFGCVLVALLSGGLGSRDSDMSFWALIVAPVTLWLAGYGAAQGAVLIKEGAPGLSLWFFTLGMILAMGVPLFSIVAYSASTFRIGEMLGSRCGRAQKVIHAVVWLSFILIPFVWALARTAGQTD